MSAQKSLLLDFIQTYRSLPELWDTKSPSYSNRSKKGAAYDQLIDKLKPIDDAATRESVVKKINNLRSAFRKELKKINDSKNSNSTYTPSLWYFGELMFLVDQETQEDSTQVSTSDIMKDDASKYTEDECLTLAKGYATKMRKLGGEQMMLADKLINDALFDAQMGLLTRGSYLVHPEVFAPWTYSSQSSDEDEASRKHRNKRKLPQRDQRKKKLYRRLKNEENISESQEPAERNSLTKWIKEEELGSS